MCFRSRKRFGGLFCAAGVAALALAASEARATSLLVSVLGTVDEHSDRVQTPVVPSDPADRSAPVFDRLDAEFTSRGVGDSPMALTDALVDLGPDGDLYLNIHTLNLAGGEFPGQIYSAGASATTDPGDGSGRPAAEGTAIPLPPSLLAGLLGLGASAFAARRRRRPL